jgi:hypothetical protein
MLQVKNIFRGVVVKTQYAKTGVARNGNSFVSYRAVLDEEKGTWGDFYLFGNPDILALLPGKMLVRGTVSLLKLEKEGMAPKVIIGAEATALEAWNQEEQRWQPLSAILIRRAKAKVEEETGEELDLDF